MMRGNEVKEGEKLFPLEWNWKARLLSLPQYWTFFRHFLSLKFSFLFFKGKLFSSLFMNRSKEKFLRIAVSLAWAEGKKKTFCFSLSIRYVRNCFLVTAATYSERYSYHAIHSFFLPSLAMCDKFSPWGFSLALSIYIEWLTFRFGAIASIERERGKNWKLLHFFQYNFCKKGKTKKKKNFVLRFAARN